MRLSRGLRQRLLLAQALLADPDLLLLDEPGAGLDEEGARLLHRLLPQLARERVVLFSTHRIDEVRPSGARVLVLVRGRPAFLAWARWRRWMDGRFVVEVNSAEEGALKPDPLPPRGWYTDCGRRLGV